MTKYDEIMEKITLSPEARDRIIENVTDELHSDGGYTHTKAGRTHIKGWMKRITAAACCILVAVGAVAVAGNDIFMNLLDGGASRDGMGETYLNESGTESDGETEDSKSTAAYDEKRVTEDMEDPREDELAIMPEYDYSGEAEMSHALGFDMNCQVIRELSEKAGLTGNRYSILKGNIGEIVFTDGERINYFRKAVGTEDISFDCNNYDIEAEFDGEDCSGTLKGKVNSYKLAVWTTANGFTYAAYLDDGLTGKEWFRVMDALTGADGKDEIP